MSFAVRVVVDRIEGDVAVLEVAGSLVPWPREALPEGTEEGAVLEVVLTPAPADLSAAEARLERLTRREP